MIQAPKWLNGIGGTSHGSFFRASDDVDMEKPPGTSTGPSTDNSLQQYVWEIVSLKAFLYSPNVTWWIMAVLVWKIQPYHDIDTLPWQDQLAERLWINHLMVFGYVGFWHVTLHICHWGHRPYVAQRTYQPGRVLHNMWYTWLGALQWTMTEVAFLYCCQTGRLEYEGSSSLSAKTLVITLVASILLPPFRDWHFYFAHRLLHTKFMFKYIHALHHRNTDCEPFCGLSMHPVEHMYYYTCYAPLLFFKWHPFLLFWMGFHVVLSPAASHSGYEDHFSGKVFHYLHHRYGDCNFGATMQLDKYFETYRDKLTPSSVATAPQDPKARLGFPPTYPLYNLLCVGLVFFGCMHPNAFSPLIMACLLSTGPCWIALFLSLDKKQPLLAPFDKDSVPSLMFHTSLGILFGVAPCTYLLYLLLSPSR